MANPNPWKARIAKRRRRWKRMKPGALAEARAMMWDTLAIIGDKIATLAESAGEDGPNTDQLYKLGQLQAAQMNSYARLVEVGEIEERLGEVATRGEQVEHKIEELEREVRESRIEA